MNKLIIKLTISLSIIFPTCSNGVEPLKKLADQYFAPPNATQIRISWFNNNHTQQLLYELKQQVATSVDLQQPLNTLSQYGLKPHRPDIIKNSYIINLSRHPKWADAQQLFEPINTAYKFKKHRIAMLEFGISHTFLDKLHRHLTQYPQHQSQQLNQQILKHYIFYQASKQQWSSYKTGEFFIKHSKKLRFSVALEWAKSTLATFDIKQQQMLIDYLQQQLRFIVIASAPLTTEALTQIGLDLKSEHQKLKRCQANTIGAFAGNQS